MIRAQDSSHPGNVVEVVVTKNLEALAAGADDVEVDLKTGRFRIPSQSIDCQIDTYPGQAT